MRRAIAILLSTIALAACNMVADAQEPPASGGGPSVSRSFDVRGFDSVALAGAQNVVVTVGPAHSVRAEGDAEVIERLDIRVKDGTLKIGMKKGNWSFRNREPVTIYVSAPALTGAAIGGSGDMQIDRVEGGSFAASIGGSGDMKIGLLRVGEADFNVAGSGAIHAAGAAERSHVAIAGSGDVDAGDLESRNASISIAGSGGVRLKAMQTADVSIIGSGDVVVTGPARCSVSKMGSGDVRCETRS